MSSIWGVDSIANADQPVPAITGKVTLYDYLVAKNLKPAFFGRYLAAPAGVHLLTSAEASYLRNKGCRILPVYRKKPTLESGEAAATKAIAAASAVGVAAGVVLYTDIEPLDKPSPEYLLGWCKTMWASKFGGAGGFYCNNWVGSDFMRAFKKALEQMATPMKNRISLWCQYPLHKCGQLTTFSPDTPSFYPDGPMVWQYALGCLKYTQGEHQYALIDMNMATQRGYDDMWK